MDVYRKFALEIISFLFTLGFSYVAYVIATPSDAYLVGSLGVLNTLTVAGLKKEVKDSLDKTSKEIHHKLKDSERLLTEHIELYRKFGEIDDPDLKREVLWFIDDIYEGRLPEHIARNRRIQLLERTNLIRASAYHETLESLYDWNKTWLSPWYKNTLELLARGGKVERNFIISKHSVLSNGKWDGEAYLILKRQFEDGVDIRIVWTEDIAQEIQHLHRDIMRNFTIFDDCEVLETDRTGQRMYRRPSRQVDLCQELFDKQRRFSKTFKEVFPDVET